jgi:hypothetical protein
MLLGQWPISQWLTECACAGNLQKPRLARRHCDDAKSGLRDKQIHQPGDVLLPRRAFSSIALVITVALAAAAGGCSSSSAVFDEIKEGNFKAPTFDTPNWAKFDRSTKTAELGPRGPVAPEDLVDAAGRCGPGPAQAAPAASPEPAAAAAAPAPAAPAPSRAKAAVGSIAGDLASAPMPQGPPPAPRPVKPKRVASASPNGGLGGLQPEGLLGAPGAQVMGGIALGMTECQAVRRAGQPSQVAIGTAAKGERKVVLTYLAGPWPGIYIFQSGRLKVVDAVPVQPKPVKPKKKKPRAPAHTAATERVFVQ